MLIVGLSRSGRYIRLLAITGLRCGGRTAVPVGLVLFVQGTWI